MPTSPTLAILSAPEDAPFVAQLRADLIAADYTIADIASERLHEDPCSEPGELRRRLEPARAVLVVLSPAAAQSEQVRCEIEFARLLDPPEAARRLVPVLISATDVPYSVRNLHTIYFTAGPYAAALERLKAYLATVARTQSESDFDAVEPAAVAAHPLPPQAGSAIGGRVPSALATMPAPVSSTFTPPVPVATGLALPAQGETAGGERLLRAPQPEPPTQPLSPPIPATAPVMAAPIPAMTVPTAPPAATGLPLPAREEQATGERSTPKRRSFWRALFGRK